MGDLVVLPGTEPVKKITVMNGIQLGVMYKTAIKHVSGILNLQGNLSGNFVIRSLSGRRNHPGIR